MLGWQVIPTASSICFQSHREEAIKAAMSLLSRYKTWVRANSTTITAAEGALSSLTWLLPDRFSGSELSLEAVNSLLGLLSLYHESILNTPPGPLPKQLPWPFWLGALQQVEVLVEMGSNTLEARNGMNKYTLLVLLEAVKAALRLLTFQKAGSRILTDGGVTATLASAVTPESKIQAVCGALARFHTRHCSAETQLGEKPSTSSAIEIMSNQIFDASKLPPRCTEDSHPSTPGADAEGMGASRHYWWEQPHLRRRHTAALSDEAYAHERLAQQRLLEAHAQWGEVAGQHLLLLGELSHILRPVVYVLALRRWGRKSWAPWLLSLALEAGSAQLLSVAASYRRVKSRTLASASSDSLSILQNLQTFRWSPLEKRELTRRRLLFLYYLIRSPCFDACTGKGVRFAQSALKPLPVVGMLSDKAAEILFGIQQYYMYTSAS